MTLSPDPEELSRLSRESGTRRSAVLDYTSGTEAAVPLLP